MKTWERDVLLLVMFGTSYHHIAGASRLLQMSSANQTSNSEYVRTDVQLMLTGRSDMPYNDLLLFITGLRKCY
jgi:hypothetical protein